jgi:hypothetical protein
MNGKSYRLCQYKLPCSNKDTNVTTNVTTVACKFNISQLSQGLAKQGKPDQLHKLTQTLLSGSLRKYYSGQIRATKEPAHNFCFAHARIDRPRSLNART